MNFLLAIVSDPPFIVIPIMQRVNSNFIEDVSVMQNAVSRVIVTLWRKVEINVQQEKKTERFPRMVERRKRNDRQRWTVSREKLQEGKRVKEEKKEKINVFPLTLDLDSPLVFTPWLCAWSENKKEKENTSMIKILNSERARELNIEKLFIKKKW